MSRPRRKSATCTCAAKASTRTRPRRCAGSACPPRRETRTPSTGSAWRISRAKARRNRTPWPTSGSRRRPTRATPTRRRRWRSAIRDRPCSSCESPIPPDAAFCPVCGVAAASPVLGETLLGISRASGSTSTSYELAPERLQAALGTAYELGRLIGRGGYAEVFAVRDLRLKRELALKVIRPALILTDALVARFRREAEAVAALQNPHIVPVYDVGEADGICWLLMPLVRGETLKTVLAREGRIAVPEARRILAEAAEGLQAAHEAGVVHRDIKPENLMIDGKTRQVLLMDFGIAKAMDANKEHAITGTGVVIGTPQYMSPEQAVGSRDPDPRSDQYALAVVGYQMLAGRVPFAGENIREVIARQLLEEPVPLSRLVPDLPPAVAATIHP